MTRFELAYAIEDALGIDASSLHGLPRPRASIGNTPDVLVGRQLDVSEAFLAPYRAEVRKLAERAAEPIARRCERQADQPTCVVAALSAPASRLFRATLSDDELRAMAAAEAKTEPTARGVASAIIRHLLESPRFYRVANEMPVRAASSKKSAELDRRRRLASRLALALHSSVPDLQLLRRAEQGALDAEPALAGEVRRLLDDPKFARFSREFTRQWLRTDRPPLFRVSLEQHTLLEDAPRFAALEQQTAAFFGALLERQAPARALLAGDDGGLLATGAFAGALSTPIRGRGDESWLGRGLLIQSSLLCRTFPLAAVYPEELWWRHPLLDPKAGETTPRPGERELLRTRTSDRPCRECHLQLETLGAALESDAFSGTNAGQAEPVAFAGRLLTGPSDLAQAVLDSGRFEPCVAEKLATYLIGRAVLPEKRREDRCLVESLAGPLGKPADSSLKSWVAAAVLSPAFREPGPEVVHDVPIPSPDPNGYRLSLPAISVDSAKCSDFDAGRFLVRSCGTAACHGLGAAITPFAVADASRASALLLAARPHPDGYCTTHERLLDPRHPRESLVVQKLLAGTKVCGSVMPITGGPQLLSALDRACFVRWVEAVAAAPK